MSRQVRCTNESLIRIDYSIINKIEIFDDLNLLCSYILDIEYLDGQRDRYFYYEKWARNKDYKRLHYFKEKRRE